MLKSTHAIIKWNSKIKKHYENLGYIYTKMGDEFKVKVNDLTKSSSTLVTVICDYCGITFEKPWHRYVAENKHSEIHKDSCCECKKYKIIETSQQKYGVKSVLSLEFIKEKIKQTNMQRYGVENPFQSNEVKQKIINTNLKKYGVKSPLQNAQILEKLKSSCMEKYGVPYFVYTQHFEGNLHPKWKGGIQYHRNERATMEYIAWRKLVYERDNYSCQCCGSKSKKRTPIYLNAHHIRNWKDNPRLRYSVKNGITLCQTCHNEFHSLFGKRNNDEAQLKEFFSNHDKKIC